MLRRLRLPFDRGDALLGLAAVVGVGLFVALIPRQHPDAAADYSLGEAGAVEAASAFLEASGYTTQGLQVRTEFRRLPDLLDSLQQDLGRRAAIAVLQGEAAERLPAYHWRVRWSRTGGEDDVGRVYTVSLNTAGGVWAFASAQDGRPEVDRMALASTFAAAPGPAEGAPALPAALTDSLLAASLFFADDDSLWGGAPARRAQAFDGAQLVQLLEAGRQQGFAQRFGLGADAALALARYHLGRSALAHLDLRADSAWVVRQSERSAALVRFVSAAPVLGQALACEVEVNPAGTLLGINTNFNGRAGAEPAEANIQRQETGTGGEVSVSVSTEGVAEAAKFITYTIVFFVLLFLLFRRINARLVDTKIALRDAFWGGFFGAATGLMFLGAELVQGMPSLWIGLAITAGGALLLGLLGAMLIFILSSASDSLARDVWPEKLEAIGLVRQGLFYNVPVGAALLRGAAVAGVLLGLCALMLLVFPRAAVLFDEGDARFLHLHVLSPAGYLVAFSNWYSLFVTLMVLLGLGTLLYRWKPSVLVVVPMLTLVMALIQVGPVDVGPPGYEWGLAALLGAGLALAFWRYDVLTCFVGLGLLQLLWGALPGWLIDGFPEWKDAAIAFGSAALVPIAGAAGVISRRAGTDVPHYVPVYVQEVAQREQLKREIEIAHQVQESFLPRRMPQVEGVDIAAMCLPAQEVGGDYFDFVQLASGKLVVMVGDVSGKGIQAAFYMTLAKGFLQTLARDVISPAEVMRRLNTLFCDNARRGTFISLIYGVLDVEARTFTFTRAGHNPVILKRSPSQEAELIQPAGMAIGLVPGPRFDDTIEEETLYLRPGDVLVFYTDGFSEAANMKKEFYGDERLARKVSDLGQRSAAEILRVVTEDVHHFVETAGRFDDMTMVVLKLERRTNHRPAASLSAGPAADA